MRGHPGIHLLAMALAAACLSGCIQWEYQRWSGPIPLDTIAYESIYDPATGQFSRLNHLEILSIQRIGDEKVIYPPSGEYKTLWLKPGEYRAKIKCDEKPGSKEAAIYAAAWIALGSDQIFNFTLKLEPEGTVQMMKCGVDANGNVFAAIVEGIEVVGT